MATAHPGGEVFCWPFPVRVVPVTWRQLLFEWYRLSESQDSLVSDALLSIAREHGLVLGRQPSSNA